MGGNLVSVSSRPLIVIDGRSGAGKSDYASALAVSMGLPVLSLDEVYPGWDGLDAGHGLIARIVFRRWSDETRFVIPLWDWQESRYRAERAIDASTGLIVEGCGALSAQSVSVATETIWMQADDEERQRRAVLRDGEQYAPHWIRWALQEERFIQLHHSPQLASRVVTG